MSLGKVIRNYTNGYIVEFLPVDENGRIINDYCRKLQLFPSESFWPIWFRICLYLYGIIYSFAGVAVGSDVFMTSITVITSRKRTILLYNEETRDHQPVDILIWNETVANLTLLALGSSAPEILLSVIETIIDLMSDERRIGGNLGFYTIVGSAAFNLFVITGVCNASIPSPSYKKVRQFGVFILTAISSLFAYFWLFITLIWFSPGIVEAWEASMTFLYFPLLVITAYATDNGWWRHKWRRSRAVADESINKDDEPVIIGMGSRRGSIGGQIAPPSGRRTTLPIANEAAAIDVDKSHLSAPNLKRNIRRLSISAPTPESIEMKTVILQSIHNESRSDFLRTKFRHNILLVLGKTCYDKIAKSNEVEPQLLSVVSKAISAPHLRSSTKCTSGSSSGSFVFASPSYAALENVGKLIINVYFHRRIRPKVFKPSSSSKLASKLSRTTTSFSTVSVNFETREGNAKANKDFIYNAGTLVFTENDFAQQIVISIIDNKQYNRDSDFYVILKNPSANATLGDPSITRITIVDDDKPGDFILEKSQLYADMIAGEAVITVLRQNGSDGRVQVDYATTDGSAKGGEEGNCEADFIHTNGRLFFDHQETSKTIKIVVNKNIKEIKNFFVSLHNPSSGSSLMEHSAAVINLNLQSGGLNTLSHVLMEEPDNSWKGQFANALKVEGEIDEYGNDTSPGCINYFLHVFTMMWKLLFALTPPQHIWGGYPAFLVSMLLIGVITAMIERLGNLIGCVTGLSSKATGIILIAMGTSLPDTIASRTAALQDSTADAAIGNITGSNSVNVFLGLGLPWVIRAIYHSIHGGVYMVETKGLRFSVGLFDTLGALCIVFLILRRFLLGGELGGEKLMKLFSSVFFFSLWLLFVGISVAQ